MIYRMLDVGLESGGEGSMSGLGGGVRPLPRTSTGVRHFMSRRTSLDRCQVRLALTSREARMDIEKEAALLSGRYRGQMSVGVGFRGPG